MKRKKKYKVSPEVRANMQAAAQKRVKQQREAAQFAELPPPAEPAPKSAFKEEIVLLQGRPDHTRPYPARPDPARPDPERPPVRLSELTRRLQSLLATYGDVPVFIMGHGKPKRIEYSPDFIEVQIAS